MKIKKRLLSVVLILAMLVPMGSYAGYTKPQADTGTIIPGTVTGVGCHRDAYGLRIGLCQCMNEDVIYDGVSKTKSQAVQEYAAKYYTPVVGEWLYVLEDASGWADRTDWVDFWGAPGQPADNFYYSNLILQGTLRNQENEALIRKNNHFQVNESPEVVNGLMEELKSLGDMNQQFYDMWKAEETSAENAKHPVIIVIEVIVPVTEPSGVYMMTAGQIAGRISGWSAYWNLCTTNIRDTYSSVSHAWQESITSKAISMICGFSEGVNQGQHDGDAWPYRATKKFFGLKYKSGYGGAEYKTHSNFGFARRAYSAWQELSPGGSEMGINGVTVLAIGGSSDELSGTYTWHINASGLSPNPHYKEDNKAEYDGTKYIGVGAVDIKQENLPSWAEWLENTQGPYTIQMEKYWIAGDDFSMDYSDVHGKRKNDTNVINSGISSNITEEIVSKDKLLDYITNGSDLDINGMGSSNPDVLEGNPIGESRYQVAYATDVRIIDNNGETVVLTNNDVHWAIYGSADDMTYIYNQIVVPGYAQVKQGDLGQEKYEAMSGTPTTEDLFITQGGEQYIVQMQYRYVEDEYVRQYTVETKEPYPNYLYYFTETPDASTVSGTLYYPVGSDYYNGSTVFESAFDPGSGALQALSKSAYRTFRDTCTIELENFISSLDSNRDAKDGYQYNTCAMPNDGGGAVAALRTWFNTNVPVNQPIRTVPIEHSPDEPPPADGLSKSSYKESSNGIVLFDAEDLDSNATGKVVVVPSFKWSVDTNYSDGEFDNHDNNCPALYGNGPCESLSGCEDGYKPTASNTYSGEFKLTVYYYNNATKEPKFIEHTETFEQHYQNVRYLDILEAQLYLLDEGVHVGLGNILAEAASPESVNLLRDAVERMGYVLYDSTQTQNRRYEGEKKWSAINATDLEETGRLINSYNKIFLEEHLGTPDDIIIEEDADHVIIKYDIEKGGGRSHVTFPTFWSKLGGRLFYDYVKGEPYRNTLYISSDVMAMQGGNAYDNQYTSFVYHEIDTGDEVITKSTNGLYQFILKEEESDFHKYGDNKLVVKGSDTSETRKVQTIPKFSDNLYLGGQVDLDLINTYSLPDQYNQKAIAVENPYTFPEVISDYKGVPWVGYRGDYLTSVESHQPKLINYPEFDLMMSAAVAQREVYGKAFPEDNLEMEESVATTGQEFPHMIGLNVKRTQANDLYKTGYSAIYYERVLNTDNLRGTGVPKLQPRYAGTMSNVHNTLPSVTSEKFAVNATYDDAWETPNDVVIYNPSTAENAFIYRLSTYMDDISGEGGEDPNNAPRDQRVYAVQLSQGLGDDIISSSNERWIDDNLTPATIEVKKLKPRSEMSTTFYKWELDYIVQQETVPISTGLKSDGRLTIEQTGTYRFTIYSTEDNSTTVLVSLEEGDVVFVQDGALFKQAKDKCVTFAEMINNTNVIIEASGNVGYDVNPYIVNDTRFDQYIFNHKIKAGDVIHLHYEFENRSKSPSTPPFTVSLLGNGITDSITSQYSISKYGDTWDYYIEFKESCTLSSVDVHFLEDNRLYSGQKHPVLDFVDAFIMSPGAAWSSPANASNTIDYVYLGNISCSYNDSFVDYIEYAENRDAVAFNTYYISYVGEVRTEFTKEAVKNPHKVYNANWKYYVVGWKTTNGNIISSPKDPLLNNDNTILQWPVHTLGYERTITVGELKQCACLVKEWNGPIRLTTVDAGLNHVILETGATVSAYDTFTLGSNANASVIPVNSDNGYPLSVGLGADKLSDNYEFFFRLLSGNYSDAALFDVQEATNLTYRYASDDTTQIPYRGEAYKLDWSVEKVEQSTSNFGVPIKDYDIEAGYLSLDDKFKIHFDNYGNFHQSDWHNVGETHNTLGMGFPDEQIDATTWIYDKYVRFPFDVYVFGKTNVSGESMADPSVTYEEYMSGQIDNRLHVGTCTVELQFFKAGENIPLGYYETDSGEADNEGHWIDFGEKCGYDYNFWVALSSNEIKSDSVVFNSVNINNHGGTETNSYPLNNDQPNLCYQRLSNAMRSDYISVVGRIGNLTMLDTGDYRFSDSFKTTRDNAPWLVYGLIRKLDPYSNRKNTTSTQQRLLLDPWDVRGRLGIPQLAGRTTYTSYTESGYYNTYGTQWHKGNEIGESNIFSLPLTSSFNVHIPLQLTLQKIGYANLLTVDSIGNYFGSSGYYNDVPYDADGAAGAYEYEGSTMANSNGDFGQMKVQVRPYYILFDTVSGESYPVDVYMRTNTDYVMINTGAVSTYETYSVLNQNPYRYYSFNNSEDADESLRTYNLDQNMLRRMVTDEESSITYDVIDSGVAGSVLSMLSRKEEFYSSYSDVWDIDSLYCYGNAQYLFLRDRNRTFVGKNSIALNYNEPVTPSTTNVYKSHAQKWYFDLGLPSSAVFVKSGQSFSIDKVLCEEGMYVLQCVDIYIQGTVWTLHYESPVSEMDIEIPNTNPTMTVNSIHPGVDWKPTGMSWLVPVTWYCPSDTTSKDDLDTEGTH